MARLARVVVRDLPHHVTQRGNRRERVFLGDDDYRLYLGLIGEAARRSTTVIASYCLMPNHVHFLMQNAGRSRAAMGPRRAMTYYIQCHRNPSKIHYTGGPDIEVDPVTGTVWVRDGRGGWLTIGDLIAQAASHSSVGQITSIPGLESANYQPLSGGGGAGGGGKPQSNQQPKQCTPGDPSVGAESGGKFQCNAAGQLGSGPIKGIPKAMVV